MSFSDAAQYLFLFAEQVGLMCLKNFSQKQRNGRQFWKDTIMIQLFTLAFVTYVLYASSVQNPSPHPYELTVLPPLSDQQPWGIFSKNSEGNNDLTLISKRLYYCPMGHPGVEALIGNLTAKYPQIEAIGAADVDGVNSLYESNLFDTWASLQFVLNSEQSTSGLLVTSQTTPSVVSYTILTNPSTYQVPLSTDNYTDEVYNDQQAAADLFWSTGYFTLQNFVATYLAQQYTTVVPPDYTIDTYIQRFPSSPIYDDKADVNLDSTRNIIWKWIGGTILSICLFIPILGILTEIVRERQYLMKDLLEISGLMNSAYWFAYLLFMFVVGQITMWFCVGFLAAVGVFTVDRVGPYAALLSVFIVGSAAFGMAFGFVIPRSEYYGLPVLLTTCALTVCGAYLGIADNINASIKQFFCFLSPSVGLTMGVLVIEGYLHSNGGSMDYNFHNTSRDYPSLNEIIGAMVGSAVFYFFITVGMPFDWLFAKENKGELFANAKVDEVKYPCDNESEESKCEDEENSAALKVTSLSHIYPDGTHAVKDVTFNVADGEVLSFLGANGAGKSTCMKMLCGTLEPTTGDATVNGFSITTQRVLARRNLGIAMQQDIIWDDINVEDHLMLFGRLRGLHGMALRTAVNEMAESLGFPEKRKFLAGTLSGGQKRRLCVGLSMVGGNKVVYLDEPTAGLDPVSRRQLWELVQRNRDGRAILLTTHFMDEADVLGDRIAIVKEGRLRALGTSRFLKGRFGIGYLLRMSLREGAPPDPILHAVQKFIPIASVSSHAGTELSIRLPREAVQIFADMLESLENNSEKLGVLSFGIETTTLEEVFMRIVNEDNEQLLSNHQEANRLLTASAEERDSNRKELNARDEKRNPLSNDLVNALLTKGENANGRSLLASLPSQTAIMLWKRFYQFVRSRGQWSMGVAVPFVLAILIGILLSTMPTDLLAPNNDYVYATYSNLERTVIGGPNPVVTQAYINEAFPGITTTYAGDSYVDVYDTIEPIATSGTGLASVDGLYYDAINNFTVLYNASYPVNFAGAVQNMLNVAIGNVTKNLLTVDQTYSTLPNNRLDYQLNNGFFVAMLISLIGGSFGAGMSIILSGERVTLVKHQQLASGASSLAYWLANFIFDSVLIFSYVLVFAIVIYIFNTGTYGGDGFGYVVGSGFFFTISSVFRFYSFSYFIADVRLAQSIYFYGSIGLVFVLIDIWFTVLFTTANGNINNGAVQALGMVFAALDPTFGWYTIILYQNNFLGILTQNDGSGFWSPEIAGGLFVMMIASCGIYGVLFVFFTENALAGLCSSCTSSKTSTQQTIRPLQVEGETSEVNHMHPIHTHKDVGYDKKKNNNKNARVSLTERGAAIDDPDVLTEKEKVHEIADSGVVNAKKSAIFICNLRKVYYARGSTPSKVAVQNINLSIPQGEIFGLLGANGAGKTTLLKIVSGLELPTSGFALINGHDVVRNTSQAQRSMGLCPQFDTLVERLTVRENLLFFGKIKGLDSDQVVPVAEAFMKAMSIKRYENKLVQQLSGGNRRKVSLAVALMGAPPTVYLDEPSTGLDPLASRLMWRLLSKISAAKSTAIVLTTHNMLECEAVCTRVCIMKMGQMVCLGDSQHLRSTHGTGFQLEVSLKSPDKAEAIQQFVSQHFAGATLIEQHLVMLNFEIPRESITKLSKAFKLLQDNKEKLFIQDYVLSQSTLEQVFLKQIRVNESDVAKLADQDEMDKRVPTTSDYVNAYLVWAAALFLPGLHHFYLGNFWRGVKYLCTGNEVVAGWLLDLFDMHVLVQKSVQEHGHTTGLCGCCLRNCCCCLGKKEGTQSPDHSVNSVSDNV